MTVNVVVLDITGLTQVFFRSEQEWHTCHQGSQRSPLCWYETSNCSHQLWNMEMEYGAVYLVDLNLFLSSWPFELCFLWPFCVWNLRTLKLKHSLLSLLSRWCWRLLPFGSLMEWEMLRKNPSSHCLHSLCFGSRWHVWCLRGGTSPPSCALLEMDLKV